MRHFIVHTRRAGHVVTRPLNCGVSRTMSAPTDNETWVVERGGDVVEKKERSGLASLGDWEHLLYCLWVADYMMRNAGDLANAPDLYPDFQREARKRAKTLGLALAGAVFALPRAQFEREYFDRFENVCAEIRNAERAG